MNKILVIAKREYRAAVRTKGFIISLFLLPVFMGGGLLVFTLLKDKTDLTDKKIAVLDRSGLMLNHIMASAKDRNESGIFNLENEKTGPAYIILAEAPDTIKPVAQKLALSNRIRSKEIHAFVEIAPDIVHPVQGNESSALLYFSENSAVDNVRDWVAGVVNNKVRELRVMELGISSDSISDLFSWVNAGPMGLLSVDSKTGNVLDARKSNEMQTIFVPYILMLLMFMMIMMSAVPLLTAVMEEKTERIAEVLLGSVTPWQFMAGKILGSLGVSLTTSVIYIAGAVFTANKTGIGELIPYEIIPWFFIYMLLDIIMIGSVMAALGASCGDSKDAQNIQFPAMLPLIIPMFFMMPVILNPSGNLAVGLSLFPLWTPMMMLLRQATSVSVPAWQIILGLAGVLVFTTLSVWAGARIFRSAIIMQGIKPRIGTLVRYILKGR